MSRFSLLYGSRGESTPDSLRMRRRLYAVFRSHEVANGNVLAQQIEGELGVEIHYNGFSWD